MLVTGHTGFKGSWLCAWLIRLGVRLHGIALEPQGEPNLWKLLHLDDTMESSYADLRDRDRTIDLVQRARPETILHLAAQSLVRRGVAEPYETFTTNVIGLVNLLDATRALETPPSFVCVTSDKVYAHGDSDRAFRESDPLGGDDPYSASKACAEIVSTAYRASYAGEHSLHICTARAGNVIGGGDWSQDRLIPDIVRALERGDEPVLRNPESTRPWQHVLDALGGYLLLAQRLHEDPQAVQGAWNFGPAEREIPTVAQVADRVLKALGGASWRRAGHGDAIERIMLRVDSSKARSELGWRSRLNIESAIDWSAGWYARRAAGEDARALVTEQIASYEALA